MGLRKSFLLLLPVLLTISCMIIFQLAAEQFGVKLGYLAGFLFYWLFWCLLVPVVLVGRTRIVQFIRPSPVFDHKIILCLSSLLIFVYAYAFPAAIKKANGLIIILSFVLAAINETVEEVLWRAVYLQTFKSTWRSVGYSSLGFAVWHYAPQTIVANKNPGGVHSFVAFAFILGLCFSYAAFRQRSIFWTIIAHTLLDFAGLGAIFYFK
jgi:membrane protease YdiL (CAAX protease family)